MVLPPATALSLTNLSSMFSKQRRRSMYVRALFRHDPSRDSALPGRGLAFEFGAILHIVNASDEEWWQARRVNSDGSEEDLGIVPSKQRVERRERARQRRVNFRKSLVVSSGHHNNISNEAAASLPPTASSSTTSAGASSTAAGSTSSKSGESKKHRGRSVLKIFKKSRKKSDSNQSGDELSDQERKKLSLNPYFCDYI